ncbi:DUF433 domain-containing protein [Roseococcus sp. DSY-14]|uniref:DUF433 domain-containing protein n=1 Tax=Roseococcus sp. DSY-14 TaxID=3369650 RepID=UPI00387AE76A
MTETPRIILDPAILAGQPVIEGTRLAVPFVLGLMAQGWTARDFAENYPGVTEAHLRACLAYARDALAGEKVFPSAA